MYSVATRLSSVETDLFQGQIEPYSIEGNGLENWQRSLLFALLGVDPAQNLANTKGGYVCSYN